MALEPTPTQGYPLVEGWTFTINQYGQQGVKSYLVGATLDGQTLEDIPSIGDAWNTDYPDVTCKSITKTYVTGCVNASKWTLNFDTTAYDQVAQPTDVNDLSKSVDVGGEFISFEPKAGSGITWLDDASDVIQPVFRNVVQATIRIPVIVGDFPTFFKQCMEQAGTVNDAVFNNLPVGNVLFTGANINEFKNSWGAKRWRADMNFVVRSLGDPTQFNLGDTWQFMLREKDGTWQKADPVTYTLYQESSFDTLFSHALGDEEDLYPNPPVR